MKTVVVVEDEYRTRNGIRNLIPKLNENFKVVGEAEDGKEGIEIINSLQPDIVFSDIKMPKIDGLRMIEDVIALNLHPIFVVITGFADFEFARTSLRLCVSDFLLKPVSTKEMKNLLDKLDKKETKKEDDNNKFSPFVRDMLIAIEKNYGCHLNLTRFAEKYNLSVEYISSVFTKETGENFSVTLKKKRVEKAKELIKSTDCKIYEVAIKVGYPDSKYFAKIFKESTGTNASKFANQNRMKRLSGNLDFKDV